MLADKLLSLWENNVKTVLFWLIVGIYAKGSKDKDLVAI